MGLFRVYRERQCKFCDFGVAFALQIVLHLKVSYQLYSRFEAGPMILRLSDLYPTCHRCAGECVQLSTIPVPNSPEEDWHFDYVPCRECNGLGSRLARGGRLLLEILRLTDVTEMEAKPRLSFAGA